MQQRQVLGVRDSKASLHRARLVACLVAVMVAAGCSTIGEDSGSTTSHKPSTLVPVARQVTVNGVDLESLLPEASDLGPDYTVVADDDDDAASDKAFDEALVEACPAADRLLGEDPNELKRSYERSDGPMVTVAVALANEGWSEADLEEVLDAFETCDAISLTHESVDIALDIFAQRSAAFGEFGMQATVDMNLDAEGLREPLHLRTESADFVAGGVGVSISISDGVDDQKGVVMSGDFGLLDPLAARIETQLGFAHPTTTTAPQPTTVPPTVAPDSTTTPSTAHPPTTTAAAPLPGSQCDLGSHPDCIDPDGDGVGTFLTFGGDCMQSFADDPGLCTDLDGDGRAGYPDGG